MTGDVHLQRTWERVAAEAFTDNCSNLEKSQVSMSGSKNKHTWQHRTVSETKQF